VLLLYVDRTQFIHIYGYKARTDLHLSGLSIKVRFQAGHPIRDKLPERVVGPPWSVIISVSSPPEIHSIRLKRLIVRRSDGTSENCRILVDGGPSTGGVTVVDATITEGEWGEHTEVTAIFEIVKQNEKTDLRIEFPIERSHSRLLRLPMR
jgi:hypothetical protein